MIAVLTGLFLLLAATVSAEPLGDFRPGDTVRLFFNTSNAGIPTTAATCGAPGRRSRKRERAYSTTSR